MKRIVRKSLFLITLAVALAGGEAVAQNVVYVEGPGEGKGITRTRGELWMLLEQYPPKLRQVLRTDHSLLGNEGYLAPYPELRNFLQRHPEVIRDPDYFLGNGNDENQSEVEELRRALEMSRRRDGPIEQVFNTLVPLSVFFAAIAVVMWIVRSVADHRRWLRVWRAQSEVHSKLMDRMTNNEELLGYLQTPAGKRFFESSVMPTDPGPRPSVPAGRIIWSVQAGLVLLLGGLALQLAKGDPQLSPGDVSALNVFGILGIALGISFVVGAATSYMISAKLGLLEQPVRRTPSNVEPPMST